MAQEEAVTVLKTALILFFFLLSTNAGAVIIGDIPSSTGCSGVVEKYENGIVVKGVRCRAGQYFLVSPKGFDDLQKIKVLSSKNIIIKGFELTSSIESSLLVKNSEGVVISENKFIGKTGKYPAKITGSNNIIVVDNLFDSDANEQLLVSNSSGLIIGSNTFKKGRHASLLFYPYGSVNEVLLYKNNFESREGRAFAFFLSEKIILFKNTIQFSAKSVYSRDSMSKAILRNSLIIGNYFTDNYGPPLSIYSLRKQDVISNLLIGGNEFKRNYFSDLFLAGLPGTLMNIDIIGNYFDESLLKSVDVEVETSDFTQLRREVSSCQNMVGEIANHRSLSINERNKKRYVSMDKLECNSAFINSLERSVPLDALFDLNWLEKVIDSIQSRNTTSTLINRSYRVIVDDIRTFLEDLLSSNRSKTRINVSTKPRTLGINSPVDIFRNIPYRVKFNENLKKPIKFNVLKRGGVALGKGLFTINTTGLLGKKLILKTVNASCESSFQLRAEGFSRLKGRIERALVAMPSAKSGSDCIYDIDLGESVLTKEISVRVLRENTIVNSIIL